MGAQAAGAALVCALLAGCGGASSGAAVLPDRGSAVALATPSPSASLTSDEIAAEAVAVVRAYYAEVNRAVATGDTTTLRSLQTSTCICRRLTQSIDDSWRDGRMRGRVFFEVRATHAIDVAPTVVSVVTTYDGHPYELLDARGRVVLRVDGKPNVSVEVEVVKEGTRWLVSHVRNS